MSLSPLRRTLLRPLTPLYSLIVRQKRLRSERNPQHRLPAPVLSIGSLSAGGAGKTPFTLLLTRLLQDHGLAPILLTRGHGRRSNITEQVDPLGDPLRFGDEPLLLAQQTGAPVYVGRDRFLAGQLALTRHPLTPQTLFLLDDGFQHLRLHRDLDLVLLTPADLRDNFLPAGNLREPLSALRSADILILREPEPRPEPSPVPSPSPSPSPESNPEPNQLTDLLQTLPHPPTLWTILRDLRFPTSAPPIRPLVFSGIARPENLTDMLHRLGIQPAATVHFRDHHRYTLGDCRRLLARAQRSEASSFLTTEKDLVKLTRAMREILATAGPLHAPRLHLTLLDPEAALQSLLQRLNLPTSPSPTTPAPA